jgi:hypothetical protein
VAPFIRQSEDVIAGRRQLEIGKRVICHQME